MLKGLFNHHEVMAKLSLYYMMYCHSLDEYDSIYIRLSDKQVVYTSLRTLI